MGCAHAHCDESRPICRFKHMKIYEARISYTVVREGLKMAACSAPEKVVEYMRDAFLDFAMQEQFFVVSLDRRNKPLCRTRITTGTATCTLAHPREVYRIAIMASAAAVVCVHNHPSGDPAPSAADIQLTRQLREAAATVDIALHDHVIVGNREDDPLGRGYYSFREAGLV